MTGTCGFKIPAFSAAISSSVFPRISVWSSPIDVRIQVSGPLIEFVASSRPPSPVSSITYSTPASSKPAIAIPNRNSKKLGWGRPSASILLTLCCVRKNRRVNVSSETGSPSIRMRSFIRIRCGDVKSPVCFLWARSIASRYTQTEPFPFVPATWMTFFPFCGLPRKERNFCVCSSVFFFVNFGNSEIYVSASW